MSENFDKHWFIFLGVLQAAIFLLVNYRLFLDPSFFEHLSFAEAMVGTISLATLVNLVGRSYIRLSHRIDDTWTTEQVWFVLFEPYVAGVVVVTPVWLVTGLLELVF